MNISEIDNQSLQTLTKQSTQFFSWIILSPIAFTTNLLVIITIIFSKSLHNKSQYVIVSHAAAEIFFALTYFGTGLARYLAYFLNQPQTANQFICIWKQLPLNIAYNVNTYLALHLAFDRFLCMAAPIFYKTMSSTKYILTLNLFWWGIGLVTNFMGFIGYDSHKLFPICAFVSAYHPSLVYAFHVSTDVVVTSTAAIYLAAASFLFYRYKTTTFNGESQKSEWRRRMDFDVFLSVTAISIFYFTNKIVTLIFNELIVISFENSISIYARITSGLNFVNSMSHIFFYICINTKFRLAFLKVICRRHVSNAVVPVDGNLPGHGANLALRTVVKAPN